MSAYKLGIEIMFYYIQHILTFYWGKFYLKYKFVNIQILLKSSYNVKDEQLLY